jgi:transcriptional regulator with XRE-family HTH domain
MAEHELAELVSRYRRQARLTQEGVAARLSDVLGRRVQQSQVSDNEKGSRWSDPDLPGAYVRALEIPVEEMMAATGYPKTTRPRPVTLADIVKNDPTLSPAARKHLLQQYQLLQLASQAERAGKGPLASESKGSRRSAAG